MKPQNSLTRVCSIGCAVAKARADDAAKARKRAAEQARQTRADRERIKTKAQWMKEAQQAVNAWVRWRDRGKDCISCGKPDDGTHQRHASHYRSTAACSSLRFNTKNIYASCAQCNTMKSGNITAFRISLVEKYGEERVLWLESQNQLRRYNISYLKRLKQLYKKRVNAARKRRTQQQR